ncbi:hypothetical protein P7M42_07025 [Vibrio parahaemolyticus]|uniref:hypothetical protein n=1 Tax=Vibrio parahaemolyticus TaxID=670 RepID=UPI0011EE3187|nr:hypothetical protein [Vibrio parahaemolyticus]MDG2790875.1 hypothetical protein [Vibrio parahaemolyticus]WHT10965.1 hypothetical protein O1N17_20655 [Vibrio parahaemolyticus]HCH6797469.1 hypothetical protein [Vibrio parahaemolyticus]
MKTIKTVIALAVIAASSSVSAASATASFERTVAQECSAVVNNTGKLLVAGETAQSGDRAQVVLSANNGNATINVMADNDGSAGGDSNDMVLYDAATGGSPIIVSSYPADWTSNSDWGTANFDLPLANRTFYAELTSPTEFTNAGDYTANVTFTVTCF